MKKLLLFILIIISFVMIIITGCSIPGHQTVSEKSTDTKLSFKKATSDGDDGPIPTPLYRYWNQGITDHFYSTDSNEIGTNVPWVTGKYGFMCEGIQCYVFQTQESGTVPLYRYWNGSMNDHFYTTNSNEISNGQYGYYLEGVQCFVYPNQAAGTIPLYRYWNQGITDHFYSTDPNDIGTTTFNETGKYGYVCEGIQCYVLPSNYLVNLNDWLTNHPNIANAIKWQYKAENSNVYIPPTDSSKISWKDWSLAEKEELNQAYINTCIWLKNGANQVQMDPNGLTDEPQNLAQISESGTVFQCISLSYMRKLYIANIAFSLALETSGSVAWSITEYDDQTLRYLFDSATMGWKIREDYYKLHTYSVYVPDKRADNLPMTSFAPPKWVYPFLKQSNLIGKNRIETIGLVLEWMRKNMVHFFGNDTYSNYNSIWQYYGFPPISKIVNGTIDANNPGYGAQHWTAGCHGSVGFLNAVLRSLNIPVQPVWACGHELPYFITEKMYMDHGDDPYNSLVKASSAPILSILIDENTYKSRFCSDVTINIKENNVSSEVYNNALSNIGKRTTEIGQ